MTVLNRWFQAAAILGVTVCYSSGDMGDGTMAKIPGQPLDYVTNFPGSSPYVLTCGGTTLDVAAKTEIVWHQKVGKGFPMAGGGGFSAVFERPPWQDAEQFNSSKWIPANKTSGTGRGLPDVSAKANLDPAFCVLAGTEIPAGGTSASAPIWAAMVAVLNEALNCPVGCINPLLYEGGLDKTLRDITEGNIGHLQAEVGWDPASGWGSPHGVAMLKALQSGK
jgi:kumamolisin